MTQTIGRDSLVLHKTKPAVVIRSGDKLEILFQDGRDAERAPQGPGGAPPRSRSTLPS